MLLFVYYCATATAATHFHSFYYYTYTPLSNGTNIEDDNKIENKLEYKMKIYFISSH